MQVADFISGPVSFVSGDFKLYDGLDLAGLILDIDTMRKATEAYRSVMNKNMEENFGARLVAVWPSPPQVLFCRDKITGVQDLKGKKIRTFNQTLADFVEGVGATAVNLSFPEVVPALQHGTVDCGITGSGPGNTAKWWEVTSYLYPLVLGWAPYFSAVNLATWNHLDKPTQDFLTTQLRQMESDMWAHVGEVAQDGINCNIGKGECRTGVKANMNLVGVSDSDRAQLKKLLVESVVPLWAKRCGQACVNDWNNSVGKVVGVTAVAK
jgi:TRAP-type C4-dicarboxylate transport system substrate-binding protein